MDTPNKTIGQKAVGLDFNPSGNLLVTEIKHSLAAVIDMVDQACDLENPVNRKIRDAALISAQMWAVKAVTWTNE